MMRTFLSERIRFRKTALIGGGVMVAFTAMITMFMFIGTDSAPNQGGPPGPTASVEALAGSGGWVVGLTGAATMLGIVALALFAISVAKDYERGTIRQLLVGEPRRALLLGGKLLALSVVIAASVAIAAIVGVGVAFAFSSSAGVSTAAWTTGAGLAEAWTAAVNVSIATVVWGLAGAAIAMATRSASAAITGGVAYLLVGENLLGLVWDSATEWLPGGTLDAFTSGGTSAVSYGRSVVMLTLYATAFVVAAFVIFARRDITD